MKLLATSTAIAMACVLSTSALAQDKTLEPVVENASDINESAREAQLTVDKISDSMQERMQQYKQIMKEIEGLQVYTNQLQNQINDQQVEMTDLNQSIDQVSYVERQITPLMIRMVDALDNFIELDVPFLEQEREERIAELRELMGKANVDVSEKFRRVMEAYQVETDYGRNIEAYTAEHSVDGDVQDVTFLRVGRVALIYKSRDGQHLGVWDNDSKQWMELDQAHRPAVETAIRIARKQVAPDMLMLPLVVNKTASTNAAD